MKLEGIKDYNEVTSMAEKKGKGFYQYNLLGELLENEEEHFPLD
ncbi:hypothetical protein [Wolbachia endosymbiont of Litomosoides brasiliensis]|nr:hypothetical protein [Wolbachia endosymbiont of Litomosoides brasiliensis]